MELARQKQARIFAAQIRIETLKALGHLGFGHLGGSLSIADLLAVLYSGEMKVDPANPNWEDRVSLSAPRATLVRRFMPHWHSGASSPRRSC